MVLNSDPGTASVRVVVTSETEGGVRWNARTFIKKSPKRGLVDPVKETSATPVRLGAEPPASAGTIHGMATVDPNKTDDVASRPGLPKDEARLEMMRRVHAMTVQQRVELFERMSRDAAWIRTAERVR